MDAAMNATARKTKPSALPIPRNVVETDFDALTAASADQHQHESDHQRLERVNREQRARWLARQDLLERGINANVTKTKIVRERLDAELTLYIDYRTKYPRAQADKVYKHLLAKINRRKGVKKISMYTLVNRDLRDLRAEQPDKIPSYHLIPYSPPK